MHRREFLTASFGLAGASSLSALGPLAEPHLEFTQTLERIPGLPDASDYSLAPNIHYLNHGSVGTIPRIVQDAHANYLSTCESNPWLYMWGGAWEPARDRTRALGAKMLGCTADEVIINRNTTDGFVLLAAGLKLAKDDEVLFSNFNHAGASTCWDHFAPRRGFQVRHFQIPIAEIPNASTKSIVASYVQAIGENTRVLVLPHIDNTLGLRTPIAAIAKAARAKGVRYIFVDGAQTLGMIPIDVTALDVDAYCCSPHKWVQSPKGIGLMYLRKSVQSLVTPQAVTWGQSKWRGTVRVFEDYGTRDLPAVLALGDALAFQQKLGIDKTSAARKRMWSAMREFCAAEKRVLWRSPQHWELGGSLYAIEFQGTNSRALGKTLWEKHRFVMRPFHGKQINTLRISPNVANTTTQLQSLLKTALS